MVAKKPIFAFKALCSQFYFFISSFTFLKSKIITFIIGLWIELQRNGYPLAAQAVSDLFVYSGVLSSSVRDYK
jgi:hypothetical protein